MKDKSMKDKSMKDKNSISRRDFLLVDYIREAISRRGFLGGLLGGAALTQLPGNASAENNIQVKMKNVARKFLKISVVTKCSYVKEGLYKLKFTFITEEEKDIVLNDNEIAALTKLTANYLEKAISRINLSSEEDIDLVYDNIKDLIRLLGEDYKSQRQNHKVSDEVSDESLNSYFIDEISKNKNGSDVLACTLLEFLFDKSKCVIKELKGKKRGFISISFSSNSLISDKDNKGDKDNEGNKYYDKINEVVMFGNKLKEGRLLSQEELEEFKEFCSVFQQKSRALPIKTDRDPEEIVQNFINAINKYIKENNSFKGEAVACILLMGNDFSMSSEYFNLVEPD